MTALVVVLAAVTASLAIVAILQRMKLQTLRYCYRMLAYYTPAEQWETTLELHAELMRNAGMDPVLKDYFEPQPAGGAS